MADQAERINRRAAEITKSVCPAGKLVAGDMGPTGKFLKPLGDLDPRDAEDSYRRQAEALLAGGADLISIETMYSLEETLCGAAGGEIAGKRLRDRLPHLQPHAERVLHHDGRRRGEGREGAAKTPAPTPSAATAAWAPRDMIELTAAIRAATPRPILIQPNAGKPLAVDDSVVYQQTAAEFAADGLRIKAAGADMIGGCCGTTPDFIRELAKAVC